MKRRPSRRKPATVCFNADDVLDRLQGIRTTRHGSYRQYDPAPPPSPYYQHPVWPEPLPRQPTTVARQSGAELGDVTSLQAQESEEEEQPVSEDEEPVSEDEEPGELQRMVAQQQSNGPSFGAVAGAVTGLAALGVGGVGFVAANPPAYGDVPVQRQDFQPVNVTEREPTYNSRDGAAFNTSDALAPAAPRPEDAPPPPAPLQVMSSELGQYIHHRSEEGLGNIGYLHKYGDQYAPDGESTLNAADLTAYVANSDDYPVLYNQGAAAAGHVAAPAPVPAPAPALVDNLAEWGATM